MEAETTQTTESTDSTEVYLKVLAWLHANQKKLIIAGSIVAVIAVAAGFMSWQQTEAENEANAQLLGVPLQTLVAGKMTPTGATPFLDVAKQHPDTSAGEYAELLAAQALFGDGKYPEAHEQFSKFIDAHPTSSLVAQAKVGVAASLEGEGKIPEAAQKYQEILLAYSAEANIVSPVKLTLARLEEQQNKFEQALTYYSELARINNPYDPWVAEARERGEFLLARHPELRKAPPGTTGTGAPPVGAQPPGTSPFAPKTAPTAPAAPANPAKP